MTGSEILKRINEQRETNHRFVKWWRKENDFLDYDLIENFENNAGGVREIGGFELLTTEDMWDEVKRVGGNRVRLVRRPSGDRVEWVHKGKSGEKKQECDFTPATLMTIFDVETKGNPVDS